MVKGNLLINKSLKNYVEKGHIVQELPEVEFEGKMYSFSHPSFQLIVSSVKAP